MTNELNLDAQLAPDTGRDRQELMAVLAEADTKHLVTCWKSLDINPECEVLRGPETGLVTLRGCIGGGGSPFNFGEATVTRATVRLGQGAVGHCVMLGRDHEKAKLAAILDALAQDAATKDEIWRKVIDPLKASQVARDMRRSSEAAATKVDFFTLVRGDD